MDIIPSPPSDRTPSIRHRLSTSAEDTGRAVLYCCTISPRRSNYSCPYDRADVTGFNGSPGHSPFIAYRARPVRTVRNVRVGLNFTVFMRRVLQDKLHRMFCFFPGFFFFLKVTFGLCCYLTARCQWAKEL